METPCSTDIFLIEGFRLDRRGLFRNYESATPAPVEIGSRALEILGLLVQRPGELITRDEIMAAAWPGTVVEDHNLTVQVSALRRVLDQGRAEGSCIQTVPGRGYRFVTPVTRASSAPSPALGPFSGNGGDRPIVEDGQSRNSVAPGASGNTNTKLAPPRARHRFGGIMAAVIGALGLVLAAAVGIGYSLWSGGLHLVPRLSIVVLPFANLSDDPKQQYFADAVTEDLTTELSRIADMLVISRDSAFTYKDRAVGAKEIGRELGVRYVLHGSVQSSGNQVRVNAQLIDAETDTHLWADRFDRGIGDLFALQDEITGRIAVTLSGELISTEANRPVENPDALDYVFRGRFVLGKAPSLENYRAGIGLFEQALAIDPQSAEAKTYLAGALVYEFRVFRRKSRMSDLARAEKLIDEVLAASAAKISYAHNVKGGLLRLKGQWQDAINEFEAALELNRNNTAALQDLGWSKLSIGAVDEVTPLAEKAIRIGPRDPRIGFLHMLIGSVHLLQAQPQEAIVWFEKARVTISNVPQLHSELASAYALAGDHERAAAELAEARRLAGDDRYSSISHLKAIGSWGVPKVEALFDATLFAGLRKAGMPEQ